MGAVPPRMPLKSDRSGARRRPCLLLSLIADGSVAVAAFQRGERIVGRSGNRAREQRDIRRVCRKSPGVAGEQEGRPVHHIAAGIVCDVIHDRPGRTGIQIG